MSANGNGNGVVERHQWSHAEDLMLQEIWNDWPTAEGGYKKKGWHVLAGQRLGRSDKACRRRATRLGLGAPKYDNGQLEIQEEAPTAGDLRAVLERLEAVEAKLDRLLNLWK